MTVIAMHAGCVMAVLIAVASTSTTAIPLPFEGNDAALAAFQRHVNLVKQFRCQIPQQRTFPIHELLNHTQRGTDGVWYPSYTVIRTCDCHTGLCGDANYTCGPTETEMLPVHFKVSSINDSRNFRFVRLNVTHHKTCGCQNASTTNERKEPRVTLDDDRH